jgi:hypothetical protein
MPATDLMKQTVEIVPRTEADDFDNRQEEGEPTETVGNLQQRRRGELEEGEVSATEWVLYLPPGTALDTTDLVRVDGFSDDFEVSGEPREVVSPRTGIASHVEATLEKAG